MLYFPQLTSGAIAQYPLRKRRIGRTLCNVYSDGTTSKLLDPGWESIEWLLTFVGLTTEERTAIETCFEAAEGRYGEVTFLDPTDNLLGWSEQLTSAPWLKDPLLDLAENIPDPNGTNRAARIANAGAASQAIKQTIDGPGWFHYCFSFYARSDQPASIEMLRSTAGADERTAAATTTSWKRFVLSGASETAGESITFGLSLEPGEAVDVFGMQVQAQPNPSMYRRTLGQGGVYPNCRFGSDVLSMTADGPDQYSCSILLIVPYPRG
jgi:hypothetical protein